MFLTLAGTCGGVAYNDVSSKTAFYREAKPTTGAVLEYAPTHERPGHRQALRVVHTHHIKLKDGREGTVRLDRQHEIGANVGVHVAPRESGTLELRPRVSDAEAASGATVTGVLGQWSWTDWLGYIGGTLVLLLAATGMGISAVQGDE